MNPSKQQSKTWQSYKHKHESRRSPETFTRDFDKLQVGIKLTYIGDQPHLVKVTIRRKDIYDEGFPMEFTGHYDQQWIDNHGLYTVIRNPGDNSIEINNAQMDLDVKYQIRGLAERTMTLGNQQKPQQLRKLQGEIMILKQQLQQLMNRPQEQEKVEQKSFASDQSGESSSIESAGIVPLRFPGVNSHSSHSEQVPEYFTVKNITDSSCQINLNQHFEKDFKPFLSNSINNVRNKYRIKLRSEYYEPHKQILVGVCSWDNRNHQLKQNSQHCASLNLNDLTLNKFGTTFQPQTSNLQFSKNETVEFELNRGQKFMRWLLSGKKLHEVKDKDSPLWRGPVCVFIGLYGVKTILKLTFA